MKNSIVIKKVMILLILVCLLIINFAKNIIFSNNDSFTNFQKDSESLVYSKIFYNNDMKNNKSKYGLASCYNIDGNIVKNILEKNQNYDKEKYVFNEYISQVGLQGHIFSFLYSKLHIPLVVIKLVCCTILAITLVLICYIIYNKYSKLMGGIFYITFLLSPWIVNFARNLYWVEFTWFLPVLFGLMLSTNYSKKKIFVPLIFMAVFIKCLCGYEYISTIMLATISFFIIDFFNTKDKNEKIKIFKTTLIVGLTCILAFLTAIAIHANLRGNGNVLEGVRTIYKEDILRRTALTSGANEFSGILRESIDASVLKTIYKYFNWNTDIILGIEGQYFKLMFIATIAILIYNILKNKENCYRDLTMFIVFLCATLSWFVLGKAHSYIHTHMNYVLWYFGFVQISIYIIIKCICEKVYEIGSNENKK